MIERIGSQGEEVGNSRLGEGDQWYRRERSEAVAYGEGKQAEKIGFEDGREANCSATVNCPNADSVLGV